MLFFYSNARRLASWGKVEVVCLGTPSTVSARRGLPCRTCEAVLGAPVRRTIPSPNGRNRRLRLLMWAATKICVVTNSIPERHLKNPGCGLDWHR